MRLCPTLCNPMECSPPGSSDYGMLQARILEWVATSFSKGSSQSSDQTWVSSIAGNFFTIWATKVSLKIQQSAGGCHFFSPGWPDTGMLHLWHSLSVLLTPSAHVAILSSTSLHNQPALVSTPQYSSHLATSFWWPRTRLPCSSESKEPACNAGDPGSAPGLGRSPEERNGNPLLAGRMPWTEGGAWQAIVRGVTES